MISDPSVASKFARGRSEARKTLEYTLHLKSAFSFAAQTPLIAGDFSSYLDDLVNAMQRDFYEFAGGRSFNFFGLKNFHSASKEYNNDLSILSMQYEFWDHILHQDAVTFAFVTLRKLIGESNEVPYYERLRMSNMENMSSESFLQFNVRFHGLDYLTPDTENAPYHIASTDSNVSAIMRNNVSLPSEERLRADSGNYKRSVNTLFNNLEKVCDTSRLFLETGSKKTERRRSLMNMFEFTNFAVPRGEQTLKNGTGILPILYLYGEKPDHRTNKFKQYMDSVKRFFSHINADFLRMSYERTTKINHNLLTSDKIYVAYQFEKLFAPMTVDCLYQNIVLTNDKPYSLCDLASVEELASCVELPNVFSRQYIVQMAIDTLTKHFDDEYYMETFFTTMLESSHMAAYKLTPRTGALQDYSKFDRWKTCYHQMMNYFVHLLFPVYENYFFCALWDGVRRSLAVRTPHPTTSDVAVNMYKLIRDYLNTEGVADHLYNTDRCISHITGMSPNMTSAIIHPRFDADQEGFKPSIYWNCLTANKLSFNHREKRIPDFISLQYLDGLSDTLAKDIQHFYILASAGLS